jgi:CRISPR system Cascade subunit CasE
MFLSRLFLNPRSREARRDLSDPYELHRTLLRGFPGLTRCDNEPSGVLFRIEPPASAGPTAVLVQSQQQPDWSFLSAGYLLGEAQAKQFDWPAFAPGKLLCFRLRANPTKRGGNSLRDRGLSGKRIALLGEEEQHDWLVRKGDEGGFRVGGVRLSAAGWVRCQKSGRELSFHAVTFDGVLEVADTVLFRASLERGIGSAKGMGSAC